MIQTLHFTEIAFAILLIAIVLVQNTNSSLSLSTMSSSMGEVTKRGPEKVLQNLTIIFGSLFVINSIALFLLK